MVARAELIDDGGRAASGPDFFRCPEFIGAEGATHSLVIQSGSARLQAPLIVRDVPGSATGLDAISPYGYPGFGIGDEASGLPIPVDEIDFSDTGLISIFIRHTLDGTPPLTGPTPRNVCLLADPALPPKSRMSDRQQVRKNEKRGYTVEFLPGPEVSGRELEGFHRAYTETMERTGAAGHYFFSREWFERILGSEATWLALARDGEGEVAAGSIAARSDGMLHYYLSGTDEAHLRDSPMKNVLTAMCEFAGERGMALNLGGGISPGDRLEEFKRGFTNREEQWFTQEIVCDPVAYRELSTGVDAEGFFPAYRAPSA